MATFTSSNVSNNCVSRELSIASSFVKQYYTLLNKAPCFIYNFYSHNSTFIHGTTDMANEQYTKPIVGREKIKKKMEEMKLNDCRAKIKQIDCLETLAGGFVIQVIGELSDNGKPMRRFLQTFVLAPSPDGSRQDGDSQHARTSTSDRRGVQLNESSANSATNQKFFVLNSIFRYQDDGPIYNEFEDDVAGSHVNPSVDNASGINTEILNKKETTPPKQAPVSNALSGNSNGSTTHISDSTHGQRKRPAEMNPEASSERLADDLDEGLKLNKATLENNDQIKHDLVCGLKEATNGLGSGTDKKSESSEKTTENGKLVTDHSLAVVSNNTTGQVAANQQFVPAPTMSRAQPSNEPKTWANMVRNAHPHSSSSPVTPIQVNKPAVVEQQQNSNQLTGTVQSVQLQQPPQHQQQPPQNQQQIQEGASNNQNNNRRRIMRKPAGRSIKNRPRKPMA